MDNRPDGARIRVLVVDDQQIVREGLTSLLELMDDIEVVASAADGAEAVRLAAELAPQVILMDLRMPGMGGVEALTHILADSPDTAVLVLSTYADDESIFAALRAGACGYLTKDATREQIALAIHNSRYGQATFDPTVSRRLAAALTGPAPAGPPGPAAGSPPAGSGGAARDCAGGGAARDRGRAAAHGERPRVYPDGLTNREADVLKLIADGLSNSEIADRLFVEESTVKTHINNAFAKISARNRADAVRYVYQRGLVRP